jgi:hypothetical protein
MKKPASANGSTKSARSERAGNVQQQQLVVQLPAITIKALKVAALERDSTVRAMLLEAIAKAGYPVPSGQAVDLRKA